MTDAVLTVEDVADRLQCSTGQVYRLINTGHLACFRVGPRLIRVRQTDLNVFLTPETVTP